MSHKFWIEESALDDPSVAVLGVRLGITEDAAFKACCRAWAWHCQCSEAELDAVARHSGFTAAMVDCGLARSTPDGIRFTGPQGERKSAALRMRARRAALPRSRRANKTRTKTRTKPERVPEQKANSSQASLFAAETGAVPKQVFLRYGPSEALKTASEASRKLQADQRAAALQATETWLAFFNRKFTRTFQVTKELQKTIGGLLARGYTERPDMRGVALYLKAEWGEDEKMAKHLVPSTILRPSKFAERLQLAKEWARQEGITEWEGA